MRLVWSQEARRALLQIREETTQEASEDRANTGIECIRERALQLLYAPRIGRRVEPELRDDLRVIPVRPRWMYYRIRPDMIEIVSIKHYRQEDALRAE